MVESIHDLNGDQGQSQLFSRQQMHWAAVERGTVMPYNATERAGVNKVGLIVSKEMGWIFREQPTDDWGIDAHLEVVLNGVPSGRLVAAQIKSGVSWFKEETEEGYVYRGNSRHLEYWRNHSLPVILILCDPDSDMTLWVAVQDQLVETTEKGWKIVVPRGRILDADSSTPLREIALPGQLERRRFDYLASLINGFASNSLSHPSSRPIFFATLFAAREEICVCSPFILNEEFAHALAIVSTSVGVRVLTGPSRSSDPYSDLTSRFPALQIRAFAAGQGQMHDRSILIDSQLLVVHSGNIVPANWGNHQEMFAAITDSEMVERYKSQFRQLWRMTEQ